MPKTDREKWVEFLESFGIGFLNGSGRFGYDLAVGKNQIVVSEGMDKVGGYSGFFTEIEFDENGAFLGINIFE